MDDEEEKIRNVFFGFQDAYVEGNVEIDRIITGKKRRYTRRKRGVAIYSLFP